METVAKNSSNNVSRNKIVVSFVQALKRRLDRYLIELWLFGSYARGDYNPDSDYDMLIVAEGDIRVECSQRRNQTAMTEFIPDRDNAGNIKQWNVD